MLFLQAGDGYPYYARPRFPGGRPTVADVLKVRARQRELGVPERDALQQGAKLVFLSAGSPQIARVYERVGFRRAGTACIAAVPD